MSKICDDCVVTDTLRTEQEIMLNACNTVLAIHQRAVKCRTGHIPIDALCKSISEIEDLSKSLHSILFERTRGIKRKKGTGFCHACGRADGSQGAFCVYNPDKEAANVD